MGSTCRNIQIGSPDIEDEAVDVGEAEAQALASKEPLRVEDQREYRGTFEGVDTTNGLCKFRPSDGDAPILGKITDPAILMAKNVYTHSLDTKRPVIVSAKAVTRDGNVVRLFISNGREH